MIGSLVSGQAAIVLGVSACAIGILVGLYLVIAPTPRRLPAERLRPDAPPAPNVLARTASGATTVIDKLMRRRGSGTGAATLEQAGLKIKPQDFTLLVLAGALAAAAVGLLINGPLVGLALAVLVILGAKVCLRVLTTRRQRAFADQLDDSLQLMASSLRAGHSLLQALDSVSREAEEPAAGEFSRIINETRVGRQLGAALEETAARMDSEDFVWVTQAIAINREVGGNLAEVLDSVGHTIRERNQIRRQVKALSAEGKLSAIVLMLLPFGIVGFLAMSNPEYLGKFTQSFPGYVMIGVAALLLIVGALWLRKVVSFKF